jgi:hypothetical protein
MADQEIRRRASIGSSMLLVLFIVLCLSTFCILSLENANSDAQMSERNAAAVQEYYRADALGTDFLQQVDTELFNASGREKLPDALKEYYQEDRDLFVTDIAMKSGQALHIELKPDWNTKTVTVASWKVYNREDYEIDQSVKVWAGES